MSGHLSKRTYKRKDGTQRTVWRARYPDPAKGGTAQIERSFPLKVEAEAWLKRAGVSVLDGLHVDPRRSATSLADVAAAWRESWGHLSESTKLGYHYTLNKHVIGTREKPGPFYRAKVGAITAEMIQRWVNNLAQHYAPAHVKRIYDVMRALMRVGVERRYIAHNPCDAVRLPKKTGKVGGRRMLTLTPDEVRTLADAMPGGYRLPVLVAAWCGLRAGELWGLRRRDVDPLHGTIMIERALKQVDTSAADVVPGLVLGTPKTEESCRRVSVPPPLMRLLEERLRLPAEPSPDGYVVVRDDEGEGWEWGLSDDPMDPDALLFATPACRDPQGRVYNGGAPVRHNLFYRRVFKPTLCGVPAKAERYAPSGAGRRRVPASPAIPAALPERLHALRWHDLRHTCASLSLAVSPNLHVVKERLGHRDIRMTINTYGHMVPSVDRALANELGVLFDATAEGPTALRSV